MSIEQTMDRREGSFANHDLSSIYRAVLRQFCRVSTSFVLFNLIFLSLFVAEVLIFLLFLPFLMQSSLLALSLSGLFLTVFSYFVLQFYFTAKKPEQMLQLKDQFISSCLQRAGLSNADAGHLTIADALSELATYLEEFEWQFYRIPQWLRAFHRPLSLFSAYCHWQDVFRFKQILFTAAIEEHLRQIRKTPTDLEVHASLANTYLAFSKLFVEPKRSLNFHSYQKKKELFEAQFRTIAKLAMNEFHILNHYAPNDPWVHEQLARGYRNLAMPEEEVKEIETILQLRPHNKDLLFRLGTIYFEQGLNAKGLKIYEELKRAQHPQAEELLTTYGQFSVNQI